MRCRFGFGVARCGLVPPAPFKMIFFIPVTLVTLDLELSIKPFQLPYQSFSASISILLGSTRNITHSTHCVPQALRWRLLRRGSRVLKRKLPPLGRKMPALVSTPTMSRAAPGYSRTNPYYRNRTHCRSYHEEEKESASYSPSVSPSVSVKEDSSQIQ
jgi:hypothetical protein